MTVAAHAIDRSSVADHNLFGTYYALYLQTQVYRYHLFHSADLHSYIVRTEDLATPSIWIAHAARTFKSTITLRSWSSYRLTLIHSSPTLA